MTKEDIAPGACFIANEDQETIRSVESVSSGMVTYVTHSRFVLGIPIPYYTAKFNVSIEQFLCLYAKNKASCFINKKGELELL